MQEHCDCAVDLDDHTACQNGFRAVGCEATPLQIGGMPSHEETGPVWAAPGQKIIIIRNWKS